MKTIVTGGAGFIGSALSAALLADGHEVSAFDDLSAGSKETVPAGVELIVGDVRRPDDLRDAFRGAEIVFHQAAVRSVPRSLAEPFIVHETNATGTLNVLLAAEAAGVRKVVYASSSSVYGGAVDGMSHEDLPTNPLSPYAVSKLTGEHYCSVWASLGRIDTVSLRYFNVFGPGQNADSKYAAVFPAFISALRSGLSPEVHWDGEQSRDFTFIDDVVAANVRAAEAPAAAGQVINVAGGRPRSINEVFASVSKVLASDLPPLRTSKRDGDIRDSYADITRARELLVWEPEAQWEEAVASTVAWFNRE